MLARFPVVSEFPVAVDGYLRIGPGKWQMPQAFGFGYALVALWFVNQPGLFPQKF